MRRGRVLFFGLPLGALCLLHDGLEVVGACISRPEQPGLSRLRRRIGAAPIFERPDLDDPRVTEALRALAPDQLASWFWTKRIPRAVLAIAPFACNVHPSLLPRHRGADPYFWALKHRDAITGVTAHRIAEEYDTGPILAQRTLAIPPRVDAWRLARLLDRPSLALFRQIAREHANGIDHASTPQDEASATHAPEPSADDCELRWSEPVDALLATIRAAAPWPGAFTDVFGETIVILDAEPAADRWPLAPGEGVCTDQGVVIGAGDGAIRVLAAREDTQDDVRRGAHASSLFPGLPSIAKRAPR